MKPVAVLLNSSIHPWGVEVCNTATQALEIDEHGVMVERGKGPDGILRDLIPWTMIKLVKLQPLPPPPNLEVPTAPEPKAKKTRRGAPSGPSRDRRGGMGARGEWRANRGADGVCARASCEPKKGAGA